MPVTSIWKYLGRAFTGALIVVLCSAALAQETIDRLVGGTWAVDERSTAGMGESFAFHRDGQLTYSFGSILDMRYTLEDHTIHATAITAPGDGATNDFSYAFEGELLVLNGGNPATRMELRRSPEFPPTSPASIVGAWDFRHPTGAKARFRFASDGRAQLLVFVKRHGGSYALQPSQMTIRLDGSPEQVVGVQLDGEKMVLTSITSPGKPAKTFSHFLVR